MAPFFIEENKNMDMYGSYQSPFGYQNGDNGVDSYGVDHSGFTTQGELQYQNLRTNRENEIIEISEI